MTPKTLTCVIVDDESANLEILSSYVTQISYLVLKATFTRMITDDGTLFKEMIARFKTYTKNLK